MTRRRLNALVVLGFGLVLAAFLVRAFGQLVVGPDRALALAGPIALLAAAVFGFVLAVWTLAATGVTDLRNAD